MNKPTKKALSFTVLFSLLVALFTMFMPRTASATGLETTPPTPKPEKMATVTIVKHFEEGYGNWLPDKVVVDFFQGKKIVKTVTINKPDPATNIWKADVTLPVGKYTISEQPLAHWRSVVRKTVVNLKKNDCVEVHLKNKIKPGELVITKEFDGKGPNKVEVVITAPDKSTKTYTLRRQHEYKLILAVKPGTYTAAEINMKPGWELDEAKSDLEAIVEPHGKGYIKLYNVKKEMPKKGTLNIEKRFETGYDQYVPTAPFNMYAKNKENGSIVPISLTKGTDNVWRGTAQLDPGEYIVYEELTKWYTKAQYVEIERKETDTLCFVNKIKPGKLYLDKDFIGGWKNQKDQPRYVVIKVTKTGEKPCYVKLWKYNGYKKAIYVMPGEYKFEECNVPKGWVVKPIKSETVEPCEIQKVRICNVKC